jgi:hypothetical protein
MTTQETPRAIAPGKPIFINWRGPQGRETIDSVYPEEFATRGEMRREASRLICEYALAGMPGAYTSTRECK